MEAGPKETAVEYLFRYFPLLFVAIGILIMLMSLKGIGEGKRFARRAQRVPGVVSDVRTVFEGRGEHLRARQRPILTFTTVDGQEITTEAWTASRLGVGNATEVLYDPQDPTRAMPAAGSGGSYAGIVAGLVAVVLGLVFFALFTGVTGSAGVREDGGTSCEIQGADGSYEPIDCPPGLELGG
jgi:hypothetical protein